MKELEGGVSTFSPFVVVDHWALIRHLGVVRRVVDAKKFVVVIPSAGNFKTRPINNWLRHCCCCFTAFASGDVPLALMLIIVFLSAQVFLCNDPHIRTTVHRAAAKLYTLNIVSSANDNKR